MRALQQHILSLIETYDGGLPLTHFLKRYFKAHPILGSRDRKMIADAVYSYYRCARALPDALSTSDKVSYSVFLAENENKHTRRLVPETLENACDETIAHKIRLLEQNGIAVHINSLLPEHIALSKGLSREDWLQSVWCKPRVFFRITTAKPAYVLDKLQQQGVIFQKELGKAYSCAAGTALEKYLAPSEYRIQDLSSQRTADFFSLQPDSSVWDCCSGAGGKSLLACETEPDIRLTVSDVRSSILNNLTERFRQYGRRVPERILVSAADPVALSEKLGNRRFDHIIADVPCTGSGTWARTPEQLHFFDPAVLSTFADRQIDILKQVAQYVKPGGTITYITCSVFEAENEAVLSAFDADDFGIAKAHALVGIQERADSMYAALIRRKA